MKIDDGFWLELELELCSLVIRQVRVQQMQYLFLVRQLHEKYKAKGKKVYFDFRKGIW